jgi:PAS domain-containing protein
VVESISDSISRLKAMDTHLSALDVFLADKVEVVASFLTCLPVPAWIKDPKTLDVIFVNPAYEEQYLVHLEEFLGNDKYKLWDEDLVKAGNLKDQIVIDTRSLLMYTNQFKLKNGILIEAEILKFPLMKNGEIIGVGGISLRSSVINEVL